jgi:signal transduction histidine kinase
VDIVHRFARDLRPTMLDDLGLIPALRSHLRDYMGNTGIRASLTVSAGIEQCDSGIRTALYRVAQEALTNVARHAHATRVDISIRETAGGISMRIEDDGSGFDVAGKTCAKTHNRLGLVGMRERIEMVGGVFSLTSAPGRPTTVQVEIPAGKPVMAAVE